MIFIEYGTTYIRMRCITTYNWPKMLINIKIEQKGTTIH